MSDNEQIVWYDCMAFFPSNKMRALHQRSARGNPRRRAEELGRIFYHSDLSLATDKTESCQVAIWAANANNAMGLLGGLEKQTKTTTRALSWPAMNDSPRNCSRTTCKHFCAA